MRSFFSKYSIQKIFLFFVLITLSFSQLTTKIYAFSLTEDPQFVVMNFSTINELNWAASEDEWQQKIKPQVIEQLHQLTQALPRGTNDRKLAWSTLQEYMNTPLDVPSENSVYAIKMRRILEVAEEENLPVFLPLNGFQWWDELPELYNWWDSDGTHTPDIFFDRQKTPDFKERFIKGYNPDNKWNVEWQSYTQPMNLNWRNWGGGGFRLAPPPNLVQNYHAPLTYRQVQRGRYEILLKVLSQKLSEWEKKGKLELFAGITIGTEVSLNASATPKDEFEPYGYRGIQDIVCPENNLNCGAQLELSSSKVEMTRQEVVAEYLNDLSRIAVNLGIPKQRIYTHVWSEAVEGEPRHSDYAHAAWNYYSRPGISLYGYADRPFALPDWSKTIRGAGFTSWGAVEYSVPKDSPAKGVQALQAVLDSEVAPAKVVTMYNWSEHKDTAAIESLKEILQRQPKQVSCSLPEIISTTTNYSANQPEITWETLGQHNAHYPVQVTATLHIHPGIQIDPPTHMEGSSNTNDVSVSQEFTVSAADFAQSEMPHFEVPQLQDGVYTWYIEMKGCQPTHQQFSEPKIMSILHPEI